MPFTAEELELIAATKEAFIETRAGDHVSRTIIWAVVDGRNVYVRSFKGASGRWYQQALSEPQVVLEVQNTRIALTAVPAIDAASVEAASEGFRRKYAKGRSRDAMVRPEVLDTTLRLEPTS